MCLRTDPRVLGWFYFSSSHAGSIGQCGWHSAKQLLPEANLTLIKRRVRVSSFYKGEMGTAHKTSVLRSGDLRPQTAGFAQSVGAHLSPPSVSLVSGLSLQPGWVRGGHGNGTFARTENPRPWSLQRPFLPPEGPRAYFRPLERKMGPGGGGCGGDIKTGSLRPGPHWPKPGVPSYSGG